VLVFQGLKAYYVDQDPEVARQRFRAAAERDADHVEAHFLAAGRSIDLAYRALSEGDVPRARDVAAEARQLVDRASRRSAFAMALPRYASQIGALDELEGDDAAAGEVYEKLASADPASAAGGAFVSWRLPQRSGALTRGLEGLEDAIRQVQNNPHPAEGWSFRVGANDVLNLLPNDDKLCLLGWAYEVSRALQLSFGGQDAPTPKSVASTRSSCGDGVVAARTVEIVCVQVLNAEQVLPQSHPWRSALQNLRTNPLRCAPDLQPLPVLPQRSQDTKGRAGSAVS
jgi:hypothetical protein